MAAEKGKGWDDSLKNLQARIDALARRKREAGEEEGHSSAEVARAVRAHRRRPATPGGDGRPAERPESAPAGPGQAAGSPTPGPGEAAGSGSVPPDRSAAGAAGGRAIVYRRDLPRRDTPSHSAPRPPGPSVALEEAVEGSEVICGDAGRAYAIPTRVDQVEGARRLSAQFSRRIGAADSAMCRRIAAATGLEEVTPEDLIFFDIESTGLAYSPLFLIGAMVWEDDSLVVHQYVARTYAEEAAVIALFAARCRGRRLLVSFNGKSYDLPTIKGRAAANRVDVDAAPQVHFDLLHECRRVWRDALPDCRLQTLEQHVCERLRRGDIPSAEIPRAYHAYVRSADAWEMVEVLKHNMLDLVTLADLMTRLPPLEEPEGAG